MPTPKPKHRTYCKSCDNFTIHTSDYICETCRTEYTPYRPSEVSEDKILQQRKRYKDRKAENFMGLYGKFILGVGLEAIMNLDSIKQEIIECDAGQVEIDKRVKEYKQLEKEEREKVLEDFNTNYKHLNRNDKCSCGSGKKYKQCCLLKFRNLCT